MNIMIVTICSIVMFIGLILWFLLLSKTDLLDKWLCVDTAIIDKAMDEITNEVEEEKEVEL